MHALPRCHVAGCRKQRSAYRRCLNHQWCTHRSRVASRRIATSRRPRRPRSAIPAISICSGWSLVAFATCATYPRRVGRGVCAPRASGGPDVVVLRRVLASRAASRVRLLLQIWRRRLSWGALPDPTIIMMMQQRRLGGHARSGVSRSSCWLRLSAGDPPSSVHPRAGCAPRDMMSYCVFRANRGPPRTRVRVVKGTLVLRGPEPEARKA